MTTVSVLTPAYNAGRYIDETIRSVRSQTFGDFEFIIVDDGSTDETAAVIRRHAAEDPRIRTVSRPNRGLVPTRNEALSLARGEFLAIVDADDVSMPERLALQVAYLREHPECVAVGGRALLVDPEGEPLILYKFAGTSHEEIDAMLMAGEGNGVCHPSSMLRREAVLAVGGYREGFQLSEDHDLFLRLAERGRLANLPDVVVKYRQHLGSICHRALERGYADSRVAVRDARQRRGLPPPGAPAEGEDLPVTDYHRLWAWWALGSGYVRTARKHALRSLRAYPLSRESWRVAVCALRGH
jgi:glycosyltransferase involved in cell wall biosynthesis